MRADLVFTGGPVHTVDAARGRAGAVAVRDGRIIAVGDLADVETGPSTEVVDLRGKLLLPGFQDAHVHAVWAGMELARCDLTGAATEAECRQRVAAYARAEPDRVWLTGSGWAMETFHGGLPTRAALDAVVADRPVLLVNRDHNGAWVNSKALELAGITRDTADPRDGRIERDHDGEPTGMLQEGAVDLVTALVPPATEADELAGLARAQRRLHSLGITAWQDPLLGDYAGMTDPTRAYLAAAADGTLTARVAGALWWDRNRGAEQTDELLARRARLRAAGVGCHTVKIMQDGIAENRTAAMLSPYLHECGGSGLSFVDPVELRAHVSTLDRLGFGVHVHALGDRAVREALDAIEAARRANGWTDHRHQLAHLQVVHPDDIRRFRQLGVVANIQPLWAVHEPQMDDLTIPFLGEQRTTWQYPFAALLRSGALLAAGSDWPVTSPDPLAAIHVAVNRIAHGDRAPAFLPEQRIDLGAAIAAYTAGSAHANRLAHTGTIAVGHAADLVVLDRDPFDGPAAEIGATRVEATFVGGRRVW